VLLRASILAPDREVRMNHECSPKMWRKTENTTGDYVFDASIQRSKNPDMQARLHQHVISSQSYGIKSAYRGYHGYSGDD
jgi:hypothetical protein